MSLSENAQKVMDLVKELNVTELNELVKSLEEEFGVSATPVVASAGAAEWGAWEEEKDTFNVELSEIGQTKIAVVKAVKELLWVGLKEAKEMVEKAPTVVKEWVWNDEWEEIKAKLEEAWATVALK